MRQQKKAVSVTVSQQAFLEQFYAEQKQFLFFTARQFRQNQEDCEDIVQEALLRIIKNVSTLWRIPEDKVRRYIVLTVRAAFLDMEKKRGSTGLVPVDDSSVPHAIERALLDREEDPSLSARLEVARLEKELPERDWILLEGKYILELSNAELAGLVGVSPDSVRMLLVRARQAARKILLNEKEKERDENARRTEEGYGCGHPAGRVHGTGCKSADPGL